ncbi:MAG: ribosomal protein S18-alanine N-acetyltransferase [Acidobacteria bacterium]|nr:ribosomal protein S18-alanine N-acetyltransferase [Acidobacteriota bacterium]
MAPAELRIRDARPEDLAEITRLEAICFPSPWPRQFFESELVAPGRFSRVVDSGDALVGYLFAMIVFDELHVNKLGVSPLHRRNGIGTHLMEDALRRAAESNVKTVWLELRASNLEGRAFYERLEFSHEYTRPNYYTNGETALIMVRRLGDS